ncbi:DUF4350 domain-containing protein [Haloferula sp. BvORR071]|uniref:DUF4350 domain-containing protein n=1 Tax=Haloferula sp. BvORR071 TaxID=1396141 RepID=UPI000551A3C8|nr:DUF4350 domain-containing protein [Haloferula sp. BvORR071]
MKRWHWLACFLGLLLAGCGSHQTIIREIGYKGKARLDAYLAAERFLERYGYTVESEPGWPDLDHDASMLIVPGSVLSTETYVREVATWVSNGGHLVCLVENAESYIDDWSQFHSRYRDEDEEVVPAPLKKWLTAMRLELGESTDKKQTAEELKTGEETYQVFAESFATVSAFKGPAGLFGQCAYGEGLISVMTDARPFRNRYIADHEHAALLLALAEQSPNEGRIIVVRDAALSLWNLLWRNAWPALIGLFALTLVWLWKNMPRFGPLRREEARSNLRDYDHHLEALGDFQWRLDRGSAMLRPLRELIIERAQRHSAAAQRGIDLFEWIGERSGIGRERAERAMTQERPPDAGTFTRVIADLQKIHLSLS